MLGDSLGAGIVAHLSKGELGELQGEEEPQLEMINVKKENGKVNEAMSNL